MLYFLIDDVGDEQDAAATHLPVAERPLHHLHKRQFGGIDATAQESQY